MNNSINSISIPFHTFEKNIEHSKLFAESKKKEPKFLKNFLFRINRYVKKLKANNPNITKSEVEEIFAKDLEEISAASYYGANISQLFMKYICYDLFSKQPDRLSHYLSRLDDINCSFEEIHDLPRSTFALTQLYYAAKLKDDFESSNYDDINKFLESSLDKMIPELKANISDSIYLVLKQLDKFDLLSSYLDINSKKMDYLHFPEYARTLLSDDPNNKTEKLFSIFLDKKIINSQSPFNLLTLYSFWINRYYKELDTYLESMFVIRDLDLVQSMIDGTFSSPSLGELHNEIVKMNLFYDPARFVLDMQKSEKLKSNNESEYDISENIYSFSDDVFLHYIQDEYGDKYKNYFDTIIPKSKNNLIEDGKHYFNLYNPIFATCGLKDATMLYLLICLKENLHYLNAGIMSNSSNYYNPVHLGKFVGLGIDNGLTDTFLLHIKKSTLLEFLNNYMVDDYASENNLSQCLPLYCGSADYTGGQYSIPVLAPMTKEQEELINKYSLKSSSSDFLSNSRFENSVHFRTGKNAGKSYGPNLPFIKHLSNVANYKALSSTRRFINIETGEVLSSPSISSLSR